MNDKTKSKLRLISAMTAFGTIGIFRKNVLMPSGFIACIRGLVGSVFLMLILALKKKVINKKAVKENLVFLLLSGGLIGFNWILLFEAYSYTSVSVATLCYYMSPSIVILLSPIFLKEKLSVKKVICVLISLIGMVLVSGVSDGEFSFSSEFKGVLMGLSAAGMYACVVMLNKKIKNIEAYDKTIIQLFTAAIVVLPYTLFAEKVNFSKLDIMSVVMLLIMGIFHTGVCYALYFGSMDSLKAQTIALFSYIDPLVALILSATILRENIGITGEVGAVMILGATAVSEIEFNKKSK